jgi:hypothetical protein
MISWLLALHIAVLGYWLGSELVINSTYRYVCFRGDMPFAERDRLMEHVMHVDQHVRYALVLQAGLGTALAALLGYVPGGVPLAWTALIVMALWLAFVEVTHRWRHRPAGRRLAALDRGSRYVILALLLLLAAGLLGGGWPLPLWLRIKLGLFALVMACGVGIRLALIQHFHTWQAMRNEGVTDQRNSVIRDCYVRATSVLVLLWVFIIAISVISVAKPW